MSDNNIVQGDLSDELYREYDIPGPNGTRVTYRIDEPKTLFQRSGGSGHRVLDMDGVVHYVPAPVAGSGVVLRWQPRPGTSPVAF